MFLGALRGVGVSDGVAQNADAFQFDLNNVARLHGLGCSRCTRVDDVSWLKRHELSDIADDVRRVKEEIARPLRLAHFTVHTGLEQQIVRV